METWELKKAIENESSWPKRQFIFCTHFKQLMDGCIIKRVRYAPWTKMGRAGMWKRVELAEINRDHLFPLLYEYLPQINIERYNRYYGLTEEPVDDGKYDNLGTTFSYEEE